MYTTKDKKGQIKVSLTLMFKINCEGQVIDFVSFEIPDLQNITIDTEIFFYYIYIHNHRYGRSYNNIYFHLKFEGQM